MNEIPKCIEYDPDPIPDDLIVSVGDRFLFIVPGEPRKSYQTIHNSIVTVSGISQYGGLAIEEYRDPDTHFVRKCFHEFTDNGELANSFDEVFG